MNVDKKWTDEDGILDFTILYPLAVYILPVEYTLFINASVTSTVFMCVFYNRTVAAMYEELIHVFNFNMDNPNDIRVHSVVCLKALHLYETFKLHLVDELEFLREYEMTKIVILEKSMGGVTIVFTIEW